MNLEEIRSQRERLGMSRLELARRASVSRYRLYAFENGDLRAELRPDEVERIRDAMQRRKEHIRRQLAETKV